MKTTSLFAMVLCLLIPSFAFGAGGDMGTGTEPLNGKYQINIFQEAE